MHSGADRAPGRAGEPSGLPPLPGSSYNPATHIDRTDHAATLLLAAVGLCWTACGARTGLLDPGDGAADAGEEDAFGVFPCDYGLSGTPTPVEGPGETVMPQIAWSGDRILVAYLVEPAGSTGVPPQLGGCTVRPSLGLSCQLHSPGFPGASHLAAAAWDGDLLGLCFTDAWTGEPMLGLVTEDGGLVRRPTSIDPGGIDCRGLAWVDNHYVAAWNRPEAAGRETVRIARLTASGEAEAEALLEFYAVGSPPIAVSVAASRSNAVAAISDGFEVSLWPLEGLPEGEVRLDAPWSTALAVALDGERAVVAWAEPSASGGATAFAAVVDVGAGRVGERVVLGSASGAIRDIRLLAVWDGFMSAWVEDGPEASRAMAVPLAVDRDLTVTPHRPIVLWEGDRAAPGAPSLTHDGHVTFAAVSYPDAEAGAEQVHIHLLACHR